jgi:hypothetical protein|eukprot:COSAG06_NODE_2438_length_6875_cov_7.162633_3_plen_71_part_00
MGIGAPVLITAPLIKLTIGVRRGKALLVNGKIERLWLRTHFRALQLLCLTAMPTSLPPVGKDSVDMRLRR